MTATLVKHPTMTLRAGKLVTVEVDVEIAHIIETLWSFGFSTQFSCQGSEKRWAYICFSGDDTAENVASLLKMTYVRSQWFPDNEAVSNHHLRVEPPDRVDQCRSVLRWHPSMTPHIADALNRVEVSS